MGLAETFKALSDDDRRKILDILKKGKSTVGDLSKELNMSFPNTSYHLNILKKADLVLEFKYKNYIYYELNTTLFDELLLWIKNFK